MTRGSYTRAPLLLAAFLLAPLLLWALAACAGAPPTPAPAALSLPPLPRERHGHRVEALADGLLAEGLLAFGGYADGAEDDTRGTRECFFLPRGGASWQRRAGLQRGRAFFGSAVIEGPVYALGDGVERYDAAADRWVEITPPGRLPASHFAAAAVGRELFVLGGYPLERSGFFVVDAATGAVQSKAPPPSFAPGDHFHFAAELAGELHVVGGLDAATFVPRREHWVRRGSAWQALPQPPAGLWARYGGQAVVGGRLYLFGEFGAWCFDPAAGTWSPRAPWPRDLLLAGVAVVDGAIVVLSGLPAGEGGAPARFVYDVGADAWRDLGR